MLVDGMSQQITHVRMQAEQLVTQLNVDLVVAAPLLQAVAALEHYLHKTLYNGFLD